MATGLLCKLVLLFSAGTTTYFWHKRPSLRTACLTALFITGIFSIHELGVTGAVLTILATTGSIGLSWFGTTGTVMLTESLSERKGIDGDIYYKPDNENSENIIAWGL